VTQHSSPVQEAERWQLKVLGRGNNSRGFGQSTKDKNNQHLANEIFHSSYMNFLV
jgi:hypothetical protein